MENKKIKFIRNLFRIQKESLAQFFGLSLIVYALLITAAIFIVFVRYQKINGTERINSDGFTLVNLLAEFGRTNLQNDKKMDLLRVIDFVSREKGLYYCIFMDSKGLPLAHIGRGFSENAVPENIVFNALNSDYPSKQIYKDPTLNKTIYEFSKPIFSDGKKSGVVRLGIIQSNYVFIKNALNTLSIAFLFTILLIPFFYYMFRNLIRPFSVIKSRLEESIKAGEFQKLEIKTKGESAEIADQVNKTMSFFDEKYHSINSTKKDLEITNRVIAYEKDRISTILDHMSDGVLAINSSGQIIYINKSINNILNISRQQAVGSKIDESIQNETILSFISESTQEGKGFEPKKQSAIKHSIDGKGVFQFVFSPLRTAEGNSLGALLVIKDISNQDMAEQAQSEFLSHVAHEIRSPLNTIKSYTELLMEGDVDDQVTQREFYNVISLETDRLAKLVENLLSISKIEMGGLSIRKGMVRPLKLIDNCIAAVMSQAVQKNIKIEKVLPDNLPALDIDKELIEVALLNVISNAIKYTPEGGKITVQAAEDQDHILFHTKDTGIGINEEDLHHIFDKFYRSSDTDTQKQKGTGLGLTLSREIVQLHGGELRAESTVGEGSCFTISMPRQSDLGRMF